MTYFIYPLGETVDSCQAVDDTCTTGFQVGPGVDPLTLGSQTTANYS